jgi:Domain of unknown function (DUF4373)
MSTESFYFSHDYSSRADEKIKNLLRKHGMIGYGIFWAIIEDLYNNANAMRTDYNGIAFDLRVDTEVVRSVINDFDLFNIEGGFFGSSSVERRLDERNAKSDKARESAFKRWHKNGSDNADALPSQSDANAIKERKGKENKEDNTVSPSNPPEPPPPETFSSPEKRTKAYLPLARYLYRIVRLSKNVNHDGKELSKWANEIRLLEEVNKIPYDRINNALVWYEQFSGGEYIPEIESGRSLRKKFTKLEDAMKREKQPINNKSSIRGTRTNGSKVIYDKPVTKV